MTQFDEAHALVRAEVDRGFMPGAVLGIATSDGVVALDAMGDGDIDDPYPLFSITKVLSGLTAARLVEDGSLDLDAPLASAVPGFGADRDDEVTLRHLVSHTAGIPEPDLDTAGPLSECLLSPGRDFAAGTATRYSSLGFAGITALIEHATSGSWEDALARTLAPVGALGVTMDSTATAHRPDLDHGTELDWHRFASLRHPGAGAVGAAPDLLRIAQSLLRDDGAIVEPGTLAMMRTSLTDGVPAFDPDPNAGTTRWGFTFNLRVAVPGSHTRDGFGHAGWAGTEMWVHPDHDVAWVLLTNVGAATDRGWDATGLDNAIVGAR